MEQRIASEYATIHVESPLRLRIIKAHLNPKLGTQRAQTVAIHANVSAASLMPDIVDEVEAAIRDEMPNKSAWTAVNINNIVLRIVARTSSRIFIGPEYCRNDEWIDVSINYTVAAFNAAYAIKRWPPLLRPFVYRFTSEYKEAVKFMEKGKAFIVPMVKERLRREDEALANGKIYTKPNDLLQWFMDGAEPSEVQDDDFMTREQLSMSMAAIHTTTMGIVQVLYELAARPEYLGPLQQELHEVLEKNDGEFTKLTMEHLKKLDSFMKESHRFNPASHCMFCFPYDGDDVETD